MEKKKGSSNLTKKVASVFAAAMATLGIADSQATTINQSDATTIQIEQVSRISPPKLVLRPNFMSPEMSLVASHGSHGSHGSHSSHSSHSSHASRVA